QETVLKLVKLFNKFIESYFFLLKKEGRVTLGSVTKRIEICHKKYMNITFKQIFQYVLDRSFDSENYEKIFFLIPELKFFYENFYKKYLYQFELYRREFEDNEFEFNYIFKKGEHVIFKGSGAKFCGKVLARRNRGLNIYYINICNLKNNCSEWFAEDIISTAGNVCINNQLTFTKYMRIYYFLPDPITQEKNAHNLALIRNEKDKLQKISDSSEEKKDAIYNIYVLADLSTQLLENIRKKIKHSDSQDKENINN
ncbi:ARID/BRIGHT DNA binding domain protein, partial [Tubulinosema ratisbonensis]